MAKWICDYCEEEFKTKKELISHLFCDFEDGNELASMAVEQLEELGATDND